VIGIEPTTFSLGTLQNRRLQAKNSDALHFSAFLHYNFQLLAGVASS